MHVAQRHADACVHKPGPCGFATGDAFVAAAFPEAPGHAGRDVGLLAFFFAGVAAVAYLALRFRTRTLR